MTKIYYPSFYRAVHRAWNTDAEDEFLCYGAEEPYEADEHDCFRMAGNIRVEMHAAGISLNVDENSPPVPELLPAAGDGFWERPALDREEPAFD